MPADGSDDEQIVVFATGRPRKAGPPGQTERDALDRQRKALAKAREEERAEQRETLQLTNKKILERLKMALGEYVPNYSTPKHGQCSPRTFSLYWGFGTPLDMPGDVLDDMELLTSMAQLKQSAREPQESGATSAFELPRSATGADDALGSVSGSGSAAVAANGFRDGPPLSASRFAMDQPLLQTPPSRRVSQPEPAPLDGTMTPRQPERPATAPPTARLRDVTI